MKQSKEHSLSESKLKGIKNTNKQTLLSIMSSFLLFSVSSEWPLQGSPSCKIKLVKKHGHGRYSYYTLQARVKEGQSSAIACSIESQNTTILICWFKYMLCFLKNIQIRVLSWKVHISNWFLYFQKAFRFRPFLSICFWSRRSLWYPTGWIFIKSPLLFLNSTGDFVILVLITLKLEDVWELLPKFSL